MSEDETRGDEGDEDEIEPDVHTEPKDGAGDDEFDPARGVVEWTAVVGGGETDDYYLPWGCRGCFDDQCRVLPVSEVLTDLDLYFDLRALPCRKESDDDLHVLSFRRTLTDRRMDEVMDQYLGHRPELRVCVSDFEMDGSHADTELFTAWLADRIDVEVDQHLESIGAETDPDVVAQMTAELECKLSLYINVVSRQNGRTPLSPERIGEVVKGRVSLEVKPSLEEWVRLLQRVVQPFRGAAFCVYAAE